MIAAAASSHSYLPWIAAIAAIASIMTFVLSARGRAYLSRLSKGQSIQTITAGFADQMAGVEAAYNVSQAENKRLEEKIASQDKLIKSQSEKISMLQDMIQSRAAVEELARQVAQAHQDTVALIRDNHTTVVSLLTAKGITP